MSQNDIMGTFLISSCVVVSLFAFFRLEKSVVNSNGQYIFQPNDCVVSKEFLDDQLRFHEKWQRVYSNEEIIQGWGKRIIQIGERSYKTRYLTDEHDHKNEWEASYDTLPFDEANLYYKKVKCPEEK